ncbi:hypothetical protein VTO73DRAFT_8841 [Trametes versicolor]
MSIYTSRSPQYFARRNKQSWYAEVHGKEYCTYLNHVESDITATPDVWDDDFDMEDSDFGTRLERYRITHAVEDYTDDYIFDDSFFVDSSSDEEESGSSEEDVPMADVFETRSPSPSLPTTSNTIESIDEPASDVFIYTGVDAGVDEMAVELSSTEHAAEAVPPKDQHNKPKSRGWAAPGPSPLHSAETINAPARNMSHVFNDEDDTGFPLPLRSLRSRLHDEEELMAAAEAIPLLRIRRTRRTKRVDTPRLRPKLYIKHAFDWICTLDSLEAYDCSEGTRAFLQRRVEGFLKHGVPDMGDEEEVPPPPMRGTAPNAPREVLSAENSPYMYRPVDGYCGDGEEVWTGPALSARRVMLLTAAPSQGDDEGQVRGAHFKTMWVRLDPKAVIFWKRTRSSLNLQL